MKKYSLKTQLSLNIAIVAMLTIAMISLVSNIFINRQFEEYIVERQRQRTESILFDLNQQYNDETKAWDSEFMHAIGMRALYDGYIVRIYDVWNRIIWDAEKHDMSACMRVMEDISQKMRERFPKGDGKFAVTNYDLERNGQRIGKVNISSFSPYFFNDDEFQFLDSLNVILAGAGIFSLLLAVAVGCLMARHLSEPIRKTAEIAKKMSGGDYVVRMGEESSISELHDLMMSINQLANSLSKQESLRKQLTADVAHELRTPLTNVATHIEAMMEGLWKLTPERLSSCHEEVERISELVRDIENLAMVESDNLKLDKTSVDLSELAEKTLRNFEGDISNKAIAVSIEGNCPAIPADRNRIHQVLTNLLSNAVKYTPTNGTIRVLLSEEVDTVLLSVEDDGIGIASDEVPFIFERFYRAGKSRNRMSGGTGIGLAIVKSIVAAHGGKIEVESHVDKGSCFQVMLPK